MANNTSDDELTLEDLVAFLCGEKSLSGRWYGEKYEGEPTFWWRPKLRQLICEREEQAAREIKTLNTHLSFMAGQYEGITGEKSTYLLKNWPEYKHLTTTHKGDK